MAVHKKDLGFGVDSKRKTKRVINPDGSFNVKQEGNKFSFNDTYQALILMPWYKFLLLIFISLVGINVLFSFIYIILGTENIQGISHLSVLDDFLQIFYFSFQTFTTVGYGHLSPIGNWVSMVSAFESMTGLVCFAIVTGMIYGRFSRPSSRLMYSENVLLAPYKDHKSLQFRVANKRMSMLLELEATVNLQFTELKNGKYHRSYHRLKLEVEKLVFFPLNWTIVHMINEGSPLYGMSETEMKEKDIEILILIKGFDDTFGQIVHSRYSYTEEDFVWDAKFDIPYETMETGDVLFHMDRISKYTSV